MIVQSIPTPTIEPIIKNKGKIKLNPHSITVVSVKIPPHIDIIQIYKLNHKFPLPSGMIPIDAVHKFNNKVPHELKIPILNTNNNIANITKNAALVSLRPTEKVHTIFSLDWDTLFQTRQLTVEEVLNQIKTPEQVHDLLPEMPQTNLQLEADKPKQLEISMPNADVPRKALNKLQHVLEAKYSTTVSKSATDIGRTNLIGLDIPTESPPIPCIQYNIKFQHVAGKDNIVAEAIPHLKTANLYEELKDQEMSKTPETIDDIMENIILEIHPQSSSSIIIPVNLDSLIAQQKSYKFCKTK